MSDIQFGKFVVNGDPAQLWCGDEPIPLRPKSLDVLQYLAKRPGNLVSKEELLNRVWSGRIISDSGVRLCIREIRNALGDNAKAPHYLETVSGSGYRFLEGRDGRVILPESKKVIVGRESELAQLEDFYQLTAQGGHQLVLVSGEAGIGKTTLVNRFLERVPEQNPTQLLKSRCIVHFGSDEAFGPLLDAITTACRDKDRANLLKNLRRHAPAWLHQMPELVDSFELERVQSQIVGLSPERMTREFCHFIEALSNEVPLIIVIEDLHWADDATVDLLAAVAEHSIPSTLIIGTYRPADAVLYCKTLRQIIKELKGRGRCEEMSLELLRKADVAEYLSGRLGGKVSEKLATQIYNRTSGNPLFMVNLIQDLIQKQALGKAQGSWVISGQSGILDSWIPESLRLLISRRIDELTDGQKEALEAASVAGINFCSAAVASSLDQTIPKLEAQFEILATKGLFIAANGIEEWPDGTISGCYRFEHPIYLEILYQDIGEARRSLLHRRIGEIVESGYLDRAEKISSILAIHFDLGYASDRAIHYYQFAAEQALSRFAYSTAVGHLLKALHNLDSTPDSMDRNQQELEILMLLGPTQIALEGYTSTAVEKTYSRAQNLCSQLDDSETIVPILWNMAGFHMARAELSKSRSLIERLDKQAEMASVTNFDLVVNAAYAQQLLFEGGFSESSVRCDSVLSQYNIAQHSQLAEIYSQEDPGLACSSISALVRWLLGFSDQSANQMRAFDNLSKELDNPHSVAFGLFFSCATQQLRKDTVATEKLAENMVNITEKHGIYLLSIGNVFRGWALAQQSPESKHLEEVETGLAGWMESGAELLVPYFLGVQAQTNWALGNVDEARIAITEALTLTEKTGERWSEAELHRLQGEMMGVENEKELLESAKCYERSLNVARNQKARSLELRAALNLSQIYSGLGRTDESSKLLAPYVSLFDGVLNTEEQRLAEKLTKTDR